jgi:predicted amidohydrolase
MEYRLGVCQFEPRFLKLEKNVQTMVELAESADADLIVYPELATSGYAFTGKEQLRSVAESYQNSETIEIFKKIARQRNCSFVFGFPEKSADRIFNSSVLINPDGSTHLYRKIHLFFEEKRWFNPGDLGFIVAPAKEGVKVGQMVCFDWIFPESARTLNLKGAQIIVHPANLVLPWCQQAMITRSLENRVFSVTANRIGTEKSGDKEFKFTGISQILSTTGKILARTNETEVGIHTAVVDPEEALNKDVTTYNNIISDRRTEYYEL